LSKGRRNEDAGKVVFFNGVKEIFDCSNENFLYVRKRWGDCCLREPSDCVSDARGRCRGDMDMMRAVVRESGAKIETGDTVPSPCTASLGWLVDEDRSSGRGNGMRAKVKWSTS
jgi:hypothetical protein